MANEQLYAGRLRALYGGNLSESQAAPLVKYLSGYTSTSSMGEKEHQNEFGLLALELANRLHRYDWIDELVAAGCQGSYSQNLGRRWRFSPPGWSPPRVELLLRTAFPRVIAELVGDYVQGPSQEVNPTRIYATIAIHQYAPEWLRWRRARAALEPYLDRDVLGLVESFMLPSTDDRTAKADFALGAAAAIGDCALVSSLVSRCLGESPRAAVDDIASGDNKTALLIAVEGDARDVVRILLV
jgi:hypothetical protein